MSPHTYVLGVLLAAPLLATTCIDEKPAPLAARVGDEPPRVRLRLTGFMEGRLEPCGCAGGQLGGLPRRRFYIRTDPDYDLLIEGGNLVTAGTPLDVQKLQTALTILAMEGTTYDALGLGPGDLKVPLDELVPLLEVFGIPSVSSDVVALEGTRWPARAHVEYPVGEARVRIAALTLALPPGEAAAGFELLQPTAAWKRAMQGVDPATYRVLLVHGPPDVAEAQAALQPRPDLIVGITDLVPEPPSEPAMVDGVPVVYPGVRGRMILDVTLTRQRGEPRLTRYRVVPLKGSQTAPGALEDQLAEDALLAHRFLVRDLDLRRAMANRLPTPEGKTYVGSSVCADCHGEAYDIWKETKHAHAWATLVQAEDTPEYGWPVTAYPDCVSCHTVGYGYESGFVSPKDTPDLLNVGCEQCHGPGSLHVETLLAKDIDLGRGASTCTGCHDFEQSPGFVAHYWERWEQIKH